MVEPTTRSLFASYDEIQGFRKLGVPFRDLHRKDYSIVVSWGLYWVPLSLGNYHMSHSLNS